jgi:outer membrane lipoprotein SlyB
MSKLRLIVLVVIALGFAGCGKSNKETAEQPAPKSEPQATQPAPAPVVKETATPVTEPMPKETQRVDAPKPAAKPKSEKKPPAVQTAQAPKASASYPEPAAAPPSPNPVVPERPEIGAPTPPKPPEPKIFTIPDGTVINVRLEDALDSGMNKSGDIFHAILDQNISVDGEIVVPRGTVITGKLSHVAQSGRVEGRAAMSLQLTGFSVENQTYAIQTEILSFEAESTKKKDAAKVGIGAGLGAVIGAIAGGGKGAAIGAAVGAGAGGATVAATRGKEVQLEKEHPLSFVLVRDIKVKLQ